MRGDGYLWVVCRSVVFTSVQAGVRRAHSDCLYRPSAYNGWAQKIWVVLEIRRGCAFSSGEYLGSLYVEWLEFRT